MRTRWWLATIAVCFAARLAFYATAFPLWEGFDEWAHFAVARVMVNEGRVVVPRDARVPLDVAASMQYVPMPGTLQNLPADAVSHEQFWLLPPEERSRREREFRSIPADFTRQPSQFAAYEASQPPFYYWLMSPLLRAARNSSLATQVFLLRWVSILIALPIILLVFLVGRTVFADDRLALGCAAVTALMPELAINLARVSNECLAVALYSAVIWFAVARRGGWGLGVVLGLGLITKAYLLAALAGMALVLWAPRALALAAAISGWWYARNLWTTGTVTGLSESVTLRATSPWAILEDADRLPWKTALDSILRSHLYFGGWSSLTVPDWMYHVAYLAIALAGVGAITLWTKPEFRSLIFQYSVLWLAQLYNVMLIYSTRGVAVSMGWYLYAAIAAQMALTIGGLRRIFGGAAIWITALICGALDLYAMHAVALPHFTGGAGWPEMFERLAIFKPPFVTQGALMALWALYLLATAVLLAASVRLARGVKRG